MSQVFNALNQAASSQQNRKDVIVVYTEDFVESLHAVVKAGVACEDADNSNDIKVYYIDGINTNYVTSGSKEANYAHNMFQIKPRLDDYQKACHLFQAGLKDIYGQDSECLTTAYNGGTEHALAKLFDKEPADNVILITSETLFPHVEQLVNQVRSCGAGVKKHVEIKTCSNEIAEKNKAYTCSPNCPSMPK